MMIPNDTYVLRDLLQTFNQDGAKDPFPADKAGIISIGREREIVNPFAS
jgi:hypothetical protein